MIGIAFVLMCMVSMSCLVVAETVEGTAYVSFESGNSDNPNVDSSQLSEGMARGSNIVWAVALAVLVLVVLVLYLIYSKKKVSTKKNFVVARKKK